MPIRAFLFDFDGLIIDTETASRAGWERLYREHGQVLPAERWEEVVGSTDVWDPMTHLEELVGEPLAREVLNDRRHSHELSLIEAEELRPGIADYIAAAERHRLKRAIVTAEGDHARAKPTPTLYLEALDALSVAADEAVVFEDSPNGVRAGKAAGIFVVAIPNAVTRDYGLEEADLVLDSLADLPPDELLARFS